MFHAYAAIRVFDEWEAVWGGNNNRVVKVDALQNQSGAFQTGLHLNVYRNSSLNPNGNYPDAFSSAPYIGNNVEGSAGNAIQQIEDDFFNNRLLRACWGIKYCLR